VKEKALVEQDKERLIINNIEKIRNEIAEITTKTGRNPGDVVLIGVTKQFPIEYARFAYLKGLCHLGENRVAELLEKKTKLEEENIRPYWHMIGSLQRKKIKRIIGQVTLIHSVDSMDILTEISKCSKIGGIKTEILIQINASGEGTKHGFSCKELQEVIQSIACCENVSVRGLMTMAPFTDQEKILHRIFDEMNTLYQQIKKMGIFEDFNVLSMGMSNDYRIALAHGATHIRIGTALFGER
jgi:PLP dependent protein